MTQRATDDPQLDIIIKVGRLFGGHPLFLTAFGCMVKMAPVSWIAADFFRIGRILGAFLTGSSYEEKRRYLDELIYNGLPITAVCSCIPAEYMRIAMRYCLEGDDAKGNFDHYSTGHGANRFNSPTRMMAEDPGGKASVERAIAAQGVKAGQVRAPNSLDWKTANWQNALGGVDAMFFKVADSETDRSENARRGDGTARVQLEIQDPYEWHPDEHRKYPCTHLWMETLKASGAQDYLVVGNGEARLTLPPELVPTPAEQAPGSDTTAPPQGSEGSSDGHAPVTAGTTTSSTSPAPTASTTDTSPTPSPEPPREERIDPDAFRPGD